MKGLLLKDLYMMKYYCRTYLLIALVFFAVLFFSDSSMFVIFYPCLFCGMIPVNLLSYDERSRFLEYSTQLPCTAKQVVSEKYLLGLMTQAAVLAVTAVVLGARMAINGTFAPRDFALLLLAVLIVSLVSAALPLPMMFKNGVEKGRLAYYVMIAFVCAASVLLAKGEWPDNIPAVAVFAGLAALGIALYGLSWYLSVVFYKKREI